tara:strand:+ start:2493 stop:2870 length:378 start_codon:yes stop_codon:yes gene_type:complete
MISELKKRRNELLAQVKAIEKKWDYSKPYNEFEDACDVWRELLEDNRRKITLISPYELDDLDKTSGDYMPFAEFADCCENGGFIDYDGFGNYATDKKVSNLTIYPSDIMVGVCRKDFTHVLWYNK